MRRVGRYLGFAVMLVAAALAVTIVASLTIDLGPAVRTAAESAGSKYIERPLHIGRLSIHLLSGKFVVEDLRIDGLHPGDRPFFTAGRLAISLDWSTAASRQPEFTVTSVELTDWQMLVEKWAGAHNFPKFTRDDNQPEGPKRFTTTLKYLRAWRGQFTYEDHETPWSIVCPNLDLNIGNVGGYHGEAVFDGGTVRIQDYVPMWANMRARFTLDGSRVHLSQIDLDTDGARTAAHGDVDFKHWPAQVYDFQSRVDFPRMRQIFFGDQRWDLSGTGQFVGTFRLTHDNDQTAHDLSGTFTSDLFGWNGYQFPALRGALQWTPTFFEVRNARAGLFGGEAQFNYSITPLGQNLRPKTARFETAYTNMDLGAFVDHQGWPGLRVAGLATGHHVMTWPLGHFSDWQNDGEMTVAAPDGVRTMTAAPAAAPAARAWGPFAPEPLSRHVPIAAAAAYRFDRDHVEFNQGHLATESTFVTFEGTTAWAENSRFAFHVNSRDWQESDQLLAGIISDFGSPTAPVAFGGRGQFDGVMTGPFRRAHVEGTFTGQDLRAWDTFWGDGTGHIAYDNGYLTVGNAIVRRGDSEIRADGAFSLSAPRDDGGEEINARFSAARTDLDALRHAFQFDDYPFSGQMSGDFHLTGARSRPVGFGTMTIEHGMYHGQSIDSATAALRFDGAGVRFDSVNLSKAGGTLTGAAFIGWDATYSFNIDGRRFPLERVEGFSFPNAPLTGVAEFSATGNGTFDAPRNDVKFRIGDLTVAREALGQVTGDLAMRGTELSGQIDAASPRLTVTGTGRIGLTPEDTSDLTLRFHDTSLDPWVRLFAPKLPPSMTAIVSGSLHLAGQLADVGRLQAEATVDAVDMRVFDFAVKNGGPIRLALENGRVSVREMELVGPEGDDTRLRVAGTVGVAQDDIALQVSGDAGLGLLQGFVQNVRSSGRAQLTAAIMGPLKQPRFSGSATITDGRIRHFALPNAFDAINGTVSFDAQGIRLDEVSATLGGGRVQFGGRIGFDGYMPGEINVTVHGEDMQLRLRDGLRSALDADLTVTGPVAAPVIGGTVMVRSAVWTRRLDAPGSIFDLARSGSSGGGGGGGGGGGEGAAVTTPVRLDMKIVVPSTLRVDTNLLKMSANADLVLQGTLDRPVLLGHADIVDRGEVNFEGRRYRITRGSIDFNNPSKVEPFFDVEMETTVRVPGSGGAPSQTYRIIVAGAGIWPDRIVPTFSSEPPLPAPDVLALLLSDARRSQDVELQRLQNPNQPQTDILTARATQALTGTLSSEVGKVVEQAFGVDTFQLTPSFIDPFGQQSGRLNPTARLTIGKRISDRVYLTFSRSLGTTINDQIVLLEYEQNDHLSWILSRNEDQQTYAIEFRLRQSF